MVIAANQPKAQAPKRRPLTFKQCDLTRALRAAVAAGMTVERVWIEYDGRIVLGFTKPVEPNALRDAREIVL